MMCNAMLLPPYDDDYQRDQDVQEKLRRDFGLSPEAHDVVLVEVTTRTDYGIHFERTLSWVITTEEWVFSWEEQRKVLVIRKVPHVRKLEPSYERYL